VVAVLVNLKPDSTLKYSGYVITSQKQKKHIMLRAIFHFFHKVEFICSIDRYQPLFSGAGTVCKQGGGTKCKDYFAPILPSICLNQKCSMVVGSFFAHSSVIEFKRRSGGEAPVLGELGDLLPKLSIFRHVFQMKFCLKIFEICSLLYVSVLKCSILVIICNYRSKCQEGSTEDPGRGEG